MPEFKNVAKKFRETCEINQLHSKRLLVPPQVWKSAIEYDHDFTDKSEKSKFFRQINISKKFSY